MAVQQLIWIVLIGAVLIVGFPVKSPDTVNEEDRLNYEKYVRQLEKKHKFAYNDIDQPWQPISDDDTSDEDDSHEIVLKLDESVSVQPLVKEEVKETAQSPVIPVADPSPAAPVIKAEETPAAQVTKAEETPATSVTKSEEIPAVDVTKAVETPVITVSKAEEAPAVTVTKTEETAVVDVTKVEEATAINTAIKAEESPAVSVTKAEEVPAVTVTKTEETAVVDVTKAEEATAINTAIKAEEAPAVTVTKTEETAVVDVTKAEEAPAINTAIKAEESPAATVTAAEEIPSATVTKTEEAPSVTVSKSEETLVITVSKAEEAPAVVVTKAEETPLVAAVIEAKKEQQVADAISESVATVAEDEVAATTTHEKLLLADIAEDDSVPATTTQEKLLASAADEVEGSGQSDPAVADVESVTIVQAINEPIEESSTFSVLKVDSDDAESATKVAQIDVAEGSVAAVQLPSDSVTNADEGSGGQPLSDIIVNDEGSGAAADLPEGSGLGDELIDHTIQPEISNDESSTGTHSDVHLSDDLANDSSSSTTEPPTTAGWKDGADEKEVKSTDTPTADEVAATEIQPSSTVRSVQAEDSTEVVVADSTDAVNDVRQESVSASDSTDRPEESATFLSVPVVNDQVADEANNDATEKNDDSHSTPSDV